MAVVTVQLLSGHPVLVTELSLYDSVKSLAQQVEREMDGKLCDLVGPNGRKLRRMTAIGNCGIADGDTLTVVMRSGPEPIPPVRTNCSHCTLQADVSVGAQHEGWGRKWSTCSYICMSCEDRIDPGTNVVVCRDCKSFMHKCCAGNGASSL